VSSTVPPSQSEERTSLRVRGRPSCSGTNREKRPPVAGLRRLLDEEVDVIKRHQGPARSDRRRRGCRARGQRGRSARHSDRTRCAQESPQLRRRPLDALRDIDGARVSVPGDRRSRAARPRSRSTRSPHQAVSSAVVAAGYQSRSHPFASEEPALAVPGDHDRWRTSSKALQIAISVTDSKAVRGR
jgi:hypothetical protein